MNLTIFLSFYLIFAHAKVLHFVFLTRTNKAVPFVLFQRINTAWELPQIKNFTDDLRNEAVIKAAVHKASFGTVLLDYEKVHILEDETGENVILVGMSLTPLNQETLDVERVRLKKLNPEVRELRIASKPLSSIANLTCIISPKNTNNFDPEFTDSLLFTDTLSVALLNQELVDKALQSAIQKENGNWKSDNIIFKLLAFPVNPIVKRQDFVIIPKYCDDRKVYWNMFDYKGRVSLPTTSSLNYSHEYETKVKQEFGMDVKEDGHLYDEISHLYVSSRNGVKEVTLLIGHVHSSRVSVVNSKKDQILCEPHSLVDACQNRKKLSIIFDENNKKSSQLLLKLEQTRFCPLITDKSARYKLFLPSGSRAAGIVPLRKVNDKIYVLLAYRSFYSGGLSIPSGSVDYPDDYKKGFDPLLVGAVRETKEESFHSLLFDYEKVQQECPSVTKICCKGSILRKFLCVVDNDSSKYSSLAIKEKILSVNEKEEIFNIHWILLSDIVEYAKKVDIGNPAPFILKAETLSDDDKNTFIGSYYLFYPSIQLFKLPYLSNLVANAVRKEAGYGTAHIKLNIYQDSVTYSGVVMLDSENQSIGFIKHPNDQQRLFIPQEENKGAFETSVNNLKPQFGINSWHVKNGIHPVINHVYLRENNTTKGLVRNIFLIEKSISDPPNSKVEWVEIKKIIGCGRLSDADKAVFLDPSALSVINFWLNFYRPVRTQRINFFKDTEEKSLVDIKSNQEGNKEMESDTQNALVNAKDKKHEIKDEHENENDPKFKIVIVVLVILAFVVIIAVVIAIKRGRSKY